MEGVLEEWRPGVRVPYQSCAICEGVEGSVRRIYHGGGRECEDASIPTNRSAPYHRCSMFGVSHLHHPISVALVHHHLSPLHSEGEEWEGLGVNSDGVHVGCCIMSCMNN